MQTTDSPGICSNILNEIAICSRHIDVLYAVSRNQPIGIIKLAQQLDLPQHQIRYSLRILESYRYIVAGAAGATTPLEPDELIMTLQAEVEALIPHIEALVTRLHNNPHHS
jgi:predicted transcriptional regulator